MDPKPGKSFTTRDGIQSAGAGALRIVLAYAVFAGLWILLSDEAMGWLFNDPSQLVLASTMKGWLFVAVTSLLLYHLIRRMAGQIQDAGRRELDAQSEKLRALELLEAIADASTDAIFAKDIDDRFIVFNRAAVRLTGKNAEEVLGRDEMAVFPPEIARNLIDDNRRVIAEDCAITFQEDLLAAEGWRTFLTTKGPMHDSGGGLIGMFGIARDITERKQAEMGLRASEERYRMVLENAADAVLVANPDGRLIYANQNASQMLGYSVDQLLAMNVQDIAPEELRDSALSQFAELKERGHVLAEGKLRRQDGSSVPVELNAVRLPDGSFYGACRNIADRKAAEHDLHQRNEELEAFNRVAIGREMAMIELKRQVNALSREVGQEAPYRLDFLDEPPQSSGGDGQA
jgi:PAS domain S-box-containing protein